MNAGDLVSRFPEIPPDLHGESLLESFANVFGAYLESASKPSACADDWTAENKVYMKLIGPMDIYRYGLSTKEKVLVQMQELIDTHASSTEAFEAELEQAGR
ncbi:MAG: hypothetical protein CME19_00700 [Gemmatimonadetes bacterium]|nr:hypothetical protein [Gemmatimonadota bacterium]